MYDGQLKEANLGAHILSSERTKMALHRSRNERNLKEIRSNSFMICSVLLGIFFSSPTHVAAQFQGAPTILEDLQAILAEILGNGTDSEYAT